MAISSLLPTTSTGTGESAIDLGAAREPTTTIISSISAFSLSYSAAIVGIATQDIPIAITKLFNLNLFDMFLIP
ncbi:MAG: hypothetical protein HRT51_08295 [Colwellia sp.]|nr:hypothetical protein [Colwellia sp.]